MTTSEARDHYDVLQPFYEMLLQPYPFPFATFSLDAVECFPKLAPTDTITPFSQKPNRLISVLKYR